MIKTWYTDSALVRQLAADLSGDDCALDVAAALAS